MLYNYKRTECEPSQFGSNREQIASTFAPYMLNAIVDWNNSA